MTIVSCIIKKTNSLKFLWQYITFVRTVFVAIQCHSYYTVYILFRFTCVTCSPDDNECHSTQENVHYHNYGIVKWKGYIVSKKNKLKERHDDICAVSCDLEKRRKHNCLWIQTFGLNSVPILFSLRWLCNGHAFRGQCCKLVCSVCEKKSAID